MIPDNIWKIYMKLLNVEKKLTTLNSHLEFLIQCKKKNCIPKGLTYKSKVNYKDLEMECQRLLDKTSQMIICKTIKYLKEERRRIDNERRTVRQDLYNITNRRSREELIGRITEVRHRLEEKLRGIKDRKLSSLLAEDKQSIKRTNEHKERTKRNRRRKHNQRKRTAKAKRIRRKVKMKERENEFIKQLGNIDLPACDRFTPFDNTGYNMTESEKEVCAKGLKFVPTIKRANLYRKKEDFERFSRALRLAVFFYNPNGQNDGGNYTRYPWTQNSTFKPPKSNAKLEEYLAAVEAELFNPANFKTIQDNLNPEQRIALNSLKEWNSDDTNPRMFRCQDKGARLVIEFKEHYHDRIINFLEDASTFREDNEDLSVQNKQKVFEWANKWYEQKEIPLDVKNWIVPIAPTPAVTHANVKTHKQNLSYRHIISSRGTATEKLARWTEHHLKPYASKHKAFLKNTTSLLNFIEDINVRKGPFDEESTILSTRDIDNFYPSCNTDKCIEAIESILNSRTDDNEINTECILEGVRITMTCNNIGYNGRHFTQINGATIGGPNSSSITDIFGSLFIDKVIEDRCPYNTEEYRRYRDDTIMINCDSTIVEQQEVTGWLNENINKDEIIFQMDKIIGNNKYVNFLDITAKIKNGYIVTETYSKTTDIHQYLNPSSCHPTQVCKGIPKSVIIRQRRNCSRTEEFIRCSREFKGYLLTSGYEERDIDKEFAPFIHVKRKKLLKEPNESQKERKIKKKYRFITDHEPTFTDIRKILKKHQYILKNDGMLAKVFPNGAKDFQVTERRGALNIKELLAPSKMRISTNEEVDPGSRPCGKGCAYCSLLDRSRNNIFVSLKTGRSYKVRQQINCESMEVIYLITCNQHNIQGIGRASSMKSRISNYRSHHTHKVRSCGISEHFQDYEHDFDKDFIFQPIVKLINNTLTSHEKMWRLEEFEVYWQQNICTIEPYGMNTKLESDKAMERIRKRKLIKT